MSFIRPDCRGLGLSLVLVVLGMATAGGASAAEPAEGAAGRMIDNPVFDSDVYVETSGDPAHPSVLLIHGLGHDASQDWYRVADQLSGRYHVLVLDLPGFGRSPAPESGALTPENYTRLVDWMIERESLDDVRLVGHSMGGAIALDYASRHADRLHNLTLISAAGILHKAAYVRAFTEQSFTLPELPAPLERSARRLMASVRSLVDDFSTLPSISEFIRSDGILGDLLGERTTIKAALALMETDFSVALDQVALPVTLIWGGNDRVAPMRTGHLLDGRLEHSRMHLLPSSGHMPMIDDPSAFQAALTNALAYSDPNAPRQRSRTPGDQHYHCDGALDQQISGAYDRIVIQDCLDATLTDVSARRIEIRNSIVALRDVRVEAEGQGAGMVIDGSQVTTTDVEITGDPAVTITGSQLDAAGTVFRAPGTAVAIEQRSEFILSVSRMYGGVYDGYLHGAGDGAHASLGSIAAVRSALSAPAQQAGLPAEPRLARALTANSRHAASLCRTSPCWHGPSTPLRPEGIR